MRYYSITPRKPGVVYNEEWLITPKKQLRLPLAPLIRRLGGREVAWRQITEEGPMLLTFGVENEEIHIRKRISQALAGYPLVVRRIPASRQYSGNHPRNTSGIESQRFQKGEGHRKAILTQEVVDFVRNRAQEGMKVPQIMQEIAEKFPWCIAGKGTYYAILSGRTWKNP